MVSDDSSTKADAAARPSAGAGVIDPWWRNAVIYQIYVRSFADGNGDGTGDLAGVRSRLPYLRDLGVDAIWFTPWYLSPLADGGYDVADYRAIDPAFGDLAEAELLIAEALALGIRTIVDIVPNHVSNEHEWFRQALVAAPGSHERDRFWFHPGSGENGDEMPTDWVSSFAGDTWTRTIDSDGTPGEWYLHLFSPEQPDLNWDNPDVRREHEEILRFWFDRGVAGIRIDSAAFLVKDAALPPLPTAPAPGEHPHLDREELHDIYRSWRRIADSYDEPRILVGEVWLADAQRFAAYLRPDEMHSAFNFDFMMQPWDAASLRASIDETLSAHEEVGAAPTWALSNHDVTRPVTRYGRERSGFAFSDKRFGTPTDAGLGERRARAAALLAAALPGSLYVYQGDELGLPEVEDLPLDALQDPMHFRSHGVDPGRDGCRVPLPWSMDGANHGFSDGDAATAWLPQPEAWRALAVESQLADPDSVLTLYRALLSVRRGSAELRNAPFQWWDAFVGDPAVLAYTRGDRFHCIVNFGEEALVLPAEAEVVLASGPLADGRLPRDTAIWLRT